MMKRLAVVLVAGAIASPAFAQDPAVAGAWLLSANVANNPYNMVCHFEQTGDKLGGDCAEAKSDGTITDKKHNLHLTAGKIEGDHISFTHRAHYLLMKFNVNYEGVLEGDRMTGKIAVFGHHGEFTAVRNDKVEIASLGAKSDPQ